MITVVISREENAGIPDALRYFLKKMGYSDDEGGPVKETGEYRIVFKRFKKEEKDESVVKSKRK